MEQMQQNATQERVLQPQQQKKAQEICTRAMGLIGSNCEYLEQHLVRIGADEASRQAVADISAALVRMERTFQEMTTLMDYLRMDEPPQLYPLDLCELLKQVAAQADMVRAQLGVEITMDYGGWTSCCVEADYRDAELLCLHLLSNALHACKEGGHVRIELCRGQTLWQMSVTDDGCGLPGGDEESILENRRCFLGGAQLGLAICRECCRRMGWGLRLEPAIGKGTQAIVSIPLYAKSGPLEEKVELRTDSDVTREQRNYHLRAMLVREMRTMPERGEPEE